MLIVALVVALLPLKLWAALAYPAYAVGVVMLIGVEFAATSSTARQRWLTLARSRCSHPS